MHFCICVQVSVCACVCVHVSVCVCTRPFMHARLLLYAFSYLYTSYYTSIALSPPYPPPPPSTHRTMLTHSCTLIPPMKSLVHLPYREKTLFPPYACLLDTSTTSWNRWVCMASGCSLNWSPPTISLRGVGTMVTVTVVLTLLLCVLNGHRCISVLYCNLCQWYLW